MSRIKCGVVFPYTRAQLSQPKQGRMSQRHFTAAAIAVLPHVPNVSYGSAPDIMVVKMLRQPIGKKGFSGAARLAVCEPQ